MQIGNGIGEMLQKIVVIGAGLSGLTAVHELAQHALSCSASGNGVPRVTVDVIEARDRVGGRILTVGGVDLGPSWFWPGMDNPVLTKLSRSLGLKTQLDRGDGAHRFVDGTSSLTQSLYDKVVKEAPDVVKFRFGEKVKEIVKVDKGLQVVLEKGETIQCDFVFLAVPPRLVGSSIQFSPPLDARAKQTLEVSRTWMAQQGKFAVIHKNGSTPSMSGASGPVDGYFTYLLKDGKRVSWGFLSNDPQWRERLSKQDLKAAALKQFNIPQDDIVQVLIHDWSEEPFTATATDLQVKDPWNHPRYPQTPLWEGGIYPNLFFIASETDNYMPGFMEGAVHAAHTRVHKWLQQQSTSTN